MNWLRLQNFAVNSSKNQAETLQYYFTHVYQPLCTANGSL